MYTYKIQIYPNNKQATKLKLIMNKCIECQNIIYDYLNSFIQTKSKFPSCSDTRKWFTKIKKIKDNEVINKRVLMTNKEQREKHLNFLFYDCTNDALKQTVKDTYNAFIRFFKKESKYPVRKSYKDNHKSYYVDPYKIDFTCSKVKLEKIANNLKRNRTILNYIKLAEKNRMPLNCKYYNPRVSFDGYNFYLTVGVSDEYAPLKYKNKKKNLVKSEESIGVDVNINSIVTSNKDASITQTILSINKTIKIKRIEKRFIKSQRALSRKYTSFIMSKKINKKAIKSRNYNKNKYKLHLLRKRLLDIRTNYLYEVINKTIFINVNILPKRIVIEDLDVKSMQETKKGKDNKYIRPELQKVSFGKILTKIKEKCNYYNIDLIEANRYYASSKICHKCKHKKEDLKLDMRIYKCDYCKEEIDRDLNAAINLANYK